MISIDIHSKPFSDFKLDAKLSFEEGRLIVITGESGAGKSSLLNCIAGLIKCSGKISIGDQICLETPSKINLKPQKRNIAYVFQESTLFPNMTVKDNLEYALGRKVDKDILDRYLSEVNLKEYPNRKPHQLSGGQKQRIDLIRSLITKPKLLLLDEPANAQDQLNRKKLQELILKEKENGMSIIMVSHDTSEIQTLADKVYLMENGVVKRDDHYKDKKSFKLKGRITHIENEMALVETLAGILELKCQNSWTIGKEITLKQEELKLEEQK